MGWRVCERESVCARARASTSRRGQLDRAMPRTNNRHTRPHPSPLPTKTHLEGSSGARPRRARPGRRRWPCRRRRRRRRGHRHRRPAPRLPCARRTTWNHVLYFPMQKTEGTACVCVCATQRHRDSGRTDGVGRARFVFLLSRRNPVRRHHNATQTLREARVCVSHRPTLAPARPPARTRGHRQTQKDATPRHALSSLCLPFFPFLTHTRPCFSPPCLSPMQCTKK
jgi:hypothetical protein